MRSLNWRLSPPLTAIALCNQRSAYRRFCSKPDSQQTAPTLPVRLAPHLRHFASFNEIQKAAAIFQVQPALGNHSLCAGTKGQRRTVEPVDLGLVGFVT